MNINSNDLAYILNENNKLITKDYVETTLQKFGIKVEIKNMYNFREAMVHLSYLVRDEQFYKNNKTKPYQIQMTDIEPIKDITKAIPLHKKSSERLEFLGDSVIHLVLAAYLFSRYDEDEGFMTKLRTKIENGYALYDLGLSISLNEYILISRYVENNGGRDKNHKIVEDAFEAFIGALYLEFGFDLCQEFLIKLIEKEVDLPQLLYKDTNYKEMLLHYFHSRKWEDPIYGTLDISGPENKKIYTMYVKCKKSPHDDGEILGTSRSSSKKKGEQLACLQALKHLGVYQDNDQSDEEEILSDDSGSTDEYLSEDSP